jgi:Helix-turn-helix domain
MAGSTIPNGTTPKSYLSPAEFSQLSGLSLATVHRYLKKGKLPYRQPGGPRGRILIPARALETEPAIGSAAHQGQAADPTSPTHPDAAARCPPLSGPRPKWTRQANPTPTKET